MHDILVDMGTKAYASKGDVTPELPPRERFKKVMYLNAKQDKRALDKIMLEIDSKMNNSDTKQWFASKAKER